MPDLIDRLAGIPPTDLQTVLLELARRRSQRRSPRDLLEQYARDHSVEPAQVNARRLATLIAAAFDSAPEFQPLQLSPVEPAGLNHVLGQIDQNSVLAAVRQSEVVADPTSALALEAAVRRRAGEAPVRLCACHRVLRMQPMDWPRHRNHFLLFGMISAARSEPDHQSEVRALREHVEAHLRLVEAARDLGSTVEDIVIRLSDTHVHQTLRDWGISPRPDVEHTPAAVTDEVFRKLGRRADRLGAALTALGPICDAVPGCRVVLDLSRTHAVGYYRGLQLSIDATINGDAMNISDGGSTDWTAKLLSDRHETLFISGTGLERLAPV